MRNEPSFEAEADVAARSWHGLGWSLMRVSDGVHGRELRELVPRPVVLDARGVDEAWGLAVATHRRTIVEGIERRPSSRTAMAHEHVLAEDRDARLDAAVGRIADRAEAPVLALGGGLDAAAVMIAWHDHTGTWPAVITLRLGRPDYDEVDAARSLCDALGASLEVVDASPHELLDLLPAAVIAAGCPLYDLHPVGRLALARAARRRGYRTLVTGDGADAAFRGQPDYDYVPVVAALTDAAGLELRSPFWDGGLLGSLLATGPDPDKAWLRHYLKRRGAPSSLVRRPKTSRMLGALELHVDAASLQPLAAELHRPLRLTTARERVSWATLHQLVSWLREEPA